MKIFVTGFFLEIFGKDNTNCRMCSKSIGIGFGNGHILRVSLDNKMYW